MVDLGLVTHISGQNVGPVFKGHAVGRFSWDCLTFGDGTEGLLIAALVRNLFAQYCCLIVANCHIDSFVINL